MKRALPIVAVALAACQAETTDPLSLRETGGALGPLARIEALMRDAGQSSAMRYALGTGARVDPDGFVLVELRTRGDASLDPSLWRRYGGRARHDFGDYAEIWIPFVALDDLRRALTDHHRLRLPPTPLPSTGAVQTEAAALTGLEPVQCTGASGQGVTVAVVDTAFGAFENTANDGEIPFYTALPPTGGNAHGTACSEIVADLAPEATIEPVKVETAGDLVALADRVVEDGIDIVSHSLTWTDISFGDGTGPFCDLVDGMAADDTVFITSAGNFGDGRFYAGTFEDVDGDLEHEFAPGDALNRFSYSGDTFTRIYLEWDAYPETDIDYDLVLLRDEGSGYQEYASSTETQDGTQRPNEQLGPGSLPAGDYAVSVRKAADGEIDVRFRLFIINGRAPNLQYSQPNGAMVDPATCANAITVGAIRAADWEAGAPVFATSSRGPTSDGRIKPDLVAPSHVSTASFGTFSGTSAAAPHVTGAAAALLSHGAPTAADAVAWVLEDAAPEGATVPNEEYGFGRLAFDPLRVGAVCEPGDISSCVTACGSTGQTTCTEQCGFGACVPPAELCNGEDDDCDGVVDQDFECALGEVQSCITTCDSTGTRACNAQCLLEECAPPIEQCNGVDDDCDGETDENCLAEPPSDEDDETRAPESNDESLNDGPSLAGGEARARGCTQSSPVWLMVALLRRRRRLA